MTNVQVALDYYKPLKYVRAQTLLDTKTLSAALLDTKIIREM